MRVVIMSACVLMHCSATLPRPHALLTPSLPTHVCSLTHSLPPMTFHPGSGGLMSWRTTWLPSVGGVHCMGTSTRTIRPHMWRPAAAAAAAAGLSGHTLFYTLNFIHFYLRGALPCAWTQALCLLPT